MPDLMEILSGVSSKDEDGPALDNDAVIFRLRERAAEMAAPNPFKVGDLVTVKADTPFKGHGDMHLVIGVNDGGYPALLPTQDNYKVGVVFNVQVLTVRDDTVMPYVLPHWALKPWTA